MKKNQLLVVVALGVLVAAFFAFDLHRYFTLEYFKAQQAAIEAYYRAHPLQTAAIYFVIYVVVTGLSLPGAAVMTLAGGAIFGLLWGTVIVSFASTIGATLAFLASRFLLRDWVQQKLGDKLKPINDGVAKEGAFYLFALRLVPAFPFVAINLLMGLTPISSACSRVPSSTYMPAPSSGNSGLRSDWSPLSRCSACFLSSRRSCSARSRRAASTPGGRGRRVMTAISS
jgi:uncharacterized membrane protein YdjX (TVP38/TMEM64 family)